VANPIPWYEDVHLPALLRHARTTYGTAMREALDAAGCGDIPANGLYVIGGLALDRKEVPLATLIRNLRISKQSAGQLVDTLVARGYLERNVDPADRRRLVVTLTRRGRAAAATQAAARESIDIELTERVGERAVDDLRRGLAALVEIGQRRNAEGGSP
jgi:DNA-binding MarR family transcriptional regulator